MEKLEIFKHYKQMFKAEQIVLTGSTALKLLGLKEKANDIDIILINPDDTTKEMLTRLNCREHPIDFETYDLFSQFYHVIDNNKKVKIDVFVEKNKKNTIKLQDDIEVSKPFDIVKVKQEYLRLKDVAELKDLSERFYTPELTNALFKIVINKTNPKTK